MTTQSIALKSFVLAADEGRTPQPLSLLGRVSTLAKLTNDDTDGTIAIFQENVLPKSGPPLRGSTIAGAVHARSLSTIL